MFSVDNTYFRVVSACGRHISLIVASVLERHPKSGKWGNMGFRVWPSTSCESAITADSETFDYSPIRGRRFGLWRWLDVRTQEYKCTCIKKNRGFLLTKQKEVGEVRERRWSRRRAGPELWLEVILSHEGTSSASLCGKTDRIQSHEGSTALPVIFPETAVNQWGKTYMMSHM